MQTAFTRFMLVVAFFLLWIGGISVRLVHLQVNQHDWLRERALAQRQDVKRSRMLRGRILDRNDRALAMSVNVKTLYADPAEITNVDSTARSVSLALNTNANELIRTLNEAKEKGRRFVPIARRVDEETVQAVNKRLDDSKLKKADFPKMAGLHWKEDQKRSYPYKSLAAHIVGFSNAEDKGQAGIEQSQDDILHGAVVRKLQDRDRLGRVYDETVFEREPPKDVVLTISNSIQYKTEQALENGVKAANAKSGMAVVLNQKTGEILALANYPTFDPNKMNDANAEDIRNNVIQSVYSPGSVFKLITYGSAIDKNLITAGAAFEPGSSVTVGGRVFNDHHAIGNATYTKAFAVSSNVGAIKTSLKVGKNDFASYIDKFGFGHKTGIELPAETAGIVRPIDKWNGDSLASMSIGYEIGVSALQMTSAFATIANDGLRIQPHIIKEIRHSDDGIISVTQPEKTQVVAPETARELRKMLREVVLTGTGKRAQLNGYTSAGKTGTAWKYNPKTKRVDGSKYISSFIGFAPADEPELTIAVVMDEPSGGGRNGGQVSAPVFKEIAEQVLPEMNVIPDGNIRQETLLAEVIEEGAASDGSETETASVEDKAIESVAAPEKITSAALAKPAAATKEIARAPTVKAVSTNRRVDKTVIAEKPKPDPRVERKYLAKDPKNPTDRKSNKVTVSHSKSEIKSKPAIGKKKQKT